MELRTWLRAGEFRWSPRFLAPVFRLAPRYSPYRPHHDRVRAIFVHVPKTAGTSVTRALFDAGARNIPLTRFQAADPRRCAQYFKFAFVRNPWDRFHSAFHYLKHPRRQLSASDGPWAARHLRGIETLEDLVAAMEDRRVRRRMMSWIHFRPQVDWVTLPGRPGPACDYIGRFESVHEDFATICGRIGVDRQLPHLRRGAHLAYRDEYSAAMIDRVAEWYQDDVRTFGYEF